MKLLEAINKGTKKSFYIRRNWWPNDINVYPLFFDFSRGLYAGTERYAPSILDLEADDWEISTNWPIKYTKYPAKKLANLELENKEYFLWLDRCREKWG